MSRKEKTDDDSGLTLLGEKEDRRSIVSGTIARTSSLNHHLANVVAGINHELSPWIGGSINSLTRIKVLLENGELTPEKQQVIKNKIDNILSSLEQSAKIMSILSRNVKHLKTHTLDKGNLKETIKSWFYITVINESIKKALEESQIKILEETLDIEVVHSPMLLSQIILNLVKNTIDHNPEILDQIKIEIYGCDAKTLVIEDNGKGVPDKVLPTLFYPEVTTKNDGEIHGLGLSTCKDYCKLMNAKIWVENVRSGGLRFYIRFES